jgi:hypothetical protein
MNELTHIKKDQTKEMMTHLRQVKQKGGLTQLKNEHRYQTKDSTSKRMKHDTAET